jgi:hypothetical protein
MQHAVARQAMALAFPSLAPQLVGAVSRKPGPATYDIPLDLTSGTSVENRSGGPTQLVLNFGANVVKGANFNITSSSGSIVSSTTSGSTLTIDLSGVTDAQTLTLSVNDLRHTSTSASGNYAFSLGVLLADANQDRVVNLADFNILASNFGTSGHSSGGGDFNFDQLVDLSDFNMLAAQFGKSFASVPARASDPLARSSSKSIFNSTSFVKRPTSDDENAVDALLLTRDTSVR